MAVQFIRKCSFIVGDVAGNGLELSDLRIRFTVSSGDTRTPWTLDARIYNLSPATAKIIRNQFTRVVLQAGYDGNFGIIFSGTIVQTKRGRESATDTFVDIIAADGDEAHRFATVNQSIAAGSTPATVLGALSASVAALGVSQGPVGPLQSTALPRGKVLYGMTRDYLDDLARNNVMSWSVQNGSLQMIPLQGYLPGQAVVINSQTGMIGIPEVTENGISVRCLLNPAIRIGRKVQLDNSTINLAKQSTNVTSVSNQYYESQDASLDADGFYRVMTHRVTGDTRGNDWYSDLICWALDGAQPINSSMVNVTPEQF